MRRLCVFGGSKLGKRPEYQQMAFSLGEELVSRGLGLVYDGASVGLKGIVADAVIAKGGEVIGVVQRNHFENEGTHRGLTLQYGVENLNHRKALMVDLSDGFIALPGGVDTFEDFFEISTWSYIQLHSKPFGLLNSSGFFSPLLELLQHSGTATLTSEKGGIP